VEFISIVKIVVGLEQLNLMENQLATTIGICNIHIQFIGHQLQ